MPPVFHKHLLSPNKQRPPLFQPLVLPLPVTGATRQVFESAQQNRDTLKLGVHASRTDNETKPPREWYRAILAGVTQAPLKGRHRAPLHLS